MIATLPKLTSLQMELDTSPEAFGWLHESNDIASDAEALRARMKEDGYLYLPGLLDRDEVLDARAEVLRRLADAGHLDESFPLDDAIPAPQAPLGFNPELAVGNAPLMKVLHSGEMMDFYDKFLGEKARCFDFTWMRTAMPGQGTAPHFDIVYMGRGTKNLWTSWTPLGDVSLEMGGLMILENGHKHERLNNNYGQKDVDTFCSNRRDENFTAMGGGGNIQQGGALTRNPIKLRKNLGGRWLTRPDFRAGDLLVFSMFTVHASLDNQSNCVRLSSDTRYQPASEPADERWIGENPIAHGPQAKRGMIC